MIKTFNIPQPIITNSSCEYFAIRYRKIQPIVGVWNNMPNTNTNNFSIDLDTNSVYEIEAIHHCCDGNDSSPTTVTFNTSNNSAAVYVCMTETAVSDSCSTTPGNCRNCEIVKSYKFKFFQNGNGTTPLNLQNSNLKLKVQEYINDVPQPPVELSMQAGINEYNYGSITTYKETCINGNSEITKRNFILLDGQFGQYPYITISCISNSPKLTETSNVSTGSGGVRTQKFQVGSDIIAGNKFQLGVYNVTKSIIAIPGDTPTSIAQKLVNAINATSIADWNQFGAAPVNQNGFPPHATSSGSIITITLNHQNNFFGAAYQ